MKQKFIHTVETVIRTGDVGQGALAGLLCSLPTRQGARAVRSMYDAALHRGSEGEITICDLEHTSCGQSNCGCIGITDSRCEDTHHEPDHLWFDESRSATWSLLSSRTVQEA